MLFLYWRPLLMATNYEWVLCFSIEFNINSFTIQNFFSNLNFPPNQKTPLSKTHELFRLVESFRFAPPWSTKKWNLGKFGQNKSPVFANGEGRYSSFLKILICALWKIGKLMHVNLCVLRLKIWIFYLFTICHPEKQFSYQNVTEKKSEVSFRNDASMLDDDAGARFSH